jgi:hypothetical protein
MQVVGFLKSKLKSSNLFGLNTDCVGFSPTLKNNGGEHNIKVGQSSPIRLVFWVELGLGPYCCRL